MKAPETGWLVLVPFNADEVLAPKDAASKTGKNARTIINWCEAYGLGRKIGGTWAISKVALAMHLDGATWALQKYLNGDRHSPDVVEYFNRTGVPLRKK